MEPSRQYEIRFTKVKQQMAAKYFKKNFIGDIMSHSQEKT
jgi:hypothetical protein